jgi:hypothetical protein
MATSPSSARAALDAIADYVEAKRRNASDEELNEIGHRFFKAWQSLQAVFDDPYR